ncbi:MAG: CoA ester lyase [Anaerolineae bacterium]
MLNPLRSILFTPGDSGRKLQKAARSGADAVVIDLEDAVAPSALADAHQLTLNALQTIDFGRSQRLVRVNGHSQEALLADIQAILPGKPDGVVVPKVETAETLTFVAENLPEEVAIFALVETALGFMHLPHILSAGPKLAGLILGGEDLIASIGAKPTPGRSELAYARSALVMAAAAYQLQAIDTVFTAWRDVDGLTEDAQTAADLGFTGKLAIHPAQLPAIHKAFSPTVEEIEWANDVLLEGQRLKEQGIGVFSFGGRMIDEAHIRLAERIIALNKQD